jgi:5-(hydroxymethyl)furfural/furfural oxidase
MDHPAVALAAFVRRGSRIEETHTRRHILIGLRYSSALPDMPKGDMFVAVASKSAWHAVGDRIASNILAVYKTYSETGQVRLAARDWRVEPVVEFNLLSDRRDLERLMEGFRMLGLMQANAALQGATCDPFGASYSDRVRQVSTVNAANKFKLQLFARLLDGPSALRRYLMNRFIVEGYRFDQLMQQDDLLEEFIRKAAVGVWHATCTCRMGAEDDPMAVTDAQGRVRAVGGLRVVDASLFPTVPCANTNFPTLMTAEKIADAALAG